jgi:hypothetical protein
MRVNGLGTIYGEISRGDSTLIYLFNSAVSVTFYIASKDKHNGQIWENMEERVCGIFWGTITEYIWRDRGIVWKNSVRIPGLRDEM